MADNFTQTDTAVTTALAAFGSGLTLSAGTTQARKASVAGTAGVTALQVSIPKSETRTICVGFEMAVNSAADWRAGTWTVRLNVTTAQSGTGITWTDVFIVRLNSAGAAQATIGSASSLGVSLATTGAKSASVTGLAQTPSAGDKVYIILAFTNSSSSTARTFSFTPNQNIDSPFAEKLTGTAVGAAGTSATLTGTGALSGTAIGSGLAAASLGNALISGTAIAAASTSSALTGRGALAGTSAGTGATSVSLTALLALTGTSVAVGATSGTLLGTGVLSATGAGVAGSSATLTGSGSLAGTSLGIAATNATLLGAGALSGTSIGAGSISASLLGSGVLTGTAAAVVASNAVLSGLAAISGTSTARGTTSANLTGNGALTGTSIAIASAVASLLGSGILSGTAMGQGMTSATLLDASIQAVIAFLVGQSLGMATTSAKLTLSGGEVSSPGTCCLACQNDGSGSAGTTAGITGLDVHTGGHEEGWAGTETQP